MLVNVYKKILNELAMLYSEATLHEMTNDFQEYQRCVNKMCSVADVLEIETEQIILKVNLKNELDS